MKASPADAALGTPPRRGPPPAECEVAVVGGGCNGVAIARDAAGRGLSVVLLERGDLAGETSGASSKLIHGGLRYLEQLELRLVRESLAERALLLAAAPHLVRPQRFVLPVVAGMRPRWQLRFGLALYDRLGGRGALPGSHALRLSGHRDGAPLRAEFGRGLEYWDASTDDARLVLGAARDAAARGARICTRTEVVAARRADGHWRIDWRDTDGRSGELRARSLVNAAGPWAPGVRQRAAEQRPGRGLRLVQGSHIVVPRLHEGSAAYVLQAGDGRVVFVIPWERQYTLIGTTERLLGAPEDTAVTPEEVAELCATVGRFLRQAPTPADVLWSFCGVRALVDDGRTATAAMTRDYAFELQTDHAARSQRAAAPLLTVLGGKLTTFRRLGERAVAALSPFHTRLGPAWTADALWPGGEFEAVESRTRARDGHAGMQAAVADFARALAARHPALSASWIEDLVARHGRTAETLLAGVGTAADLGPDLGPPAHPAPAAHLYERELAHFVEHEWATTVDDILLRRSKAVLVADAATRARLGKWLTERRGGRD